MLNATILLVFLEIFVKLKCRYDQKENKKNGGNFEINCWTW